MLKSNRAKDRMASGQAVFGCMMQQLRSTEVPRVFAAAGFDFLFIDTEHGSFDLETVRDLVQVSLTSEITPIVRVGELQYSLIARALDVGAQGVILPRVEDAEILARAISWTKFPPSGVRGFGIAGPLLDYESAQFSEIVAHLNTNTLVIVQFESEFALTHSRELLSVPGIDVALVGPADLSISLGLPGEFEHPRLVSAIEQFCEDCRRHEIVPGIQVRTPSLAQKWATRGMRFIGCGSEHSLLLEKAKESVETLRRSSSQN
jgi:2-keto-3-deoxy-L-rhamnonate aldolase RhmA